MVTGIIIGVANATFAIFFSVWWGTLVRVGLGNLEGSEEFHWYNGNCVAWGVILLILFAFFAWCVAEVRQSFVDKNRQKLRRFFALSVLASQGLVLFAFSVIPNLVATAKGDIVLQHHGILLIMTWILSLYVINGICYDKFTWFLLFPLIVTLLVLEWFLTFALRHLKSYLRQLNDTEQGGRQT